MGAMYDEAAVDEAIRGVLAAEVAAEERVRAAQGNAEALREAARSDARTIAARTERRIGTLRQHFEALTRRDVARLDAQCSEYSPGTPVDVVEPQQLARAVAAVAAELTGEGPSAAPAAASVGAHQ